MEIKNTKKLITFSPRNLAMIEAIMNETGWDTSTQVVRRGIEELYKQTFKYGKDPLSSALPTDSTEVIFKKAKVKALTKQAQKDAELEARIAPKMDMCVNLLGGQVEANENGHKFCRYTTYSLNGDYEQKLPILQVDPVIAETSLFTPTKELIFEERPDIAKKFNKLSFYK